MRTKPISRGARPSEEEGLLPHVAYDFGLSRRSFAQVLGAGLLIAVHPEEVFGQRSRGRGRGGGGGSAVIVSARIHIGKDGVITAMSGKIEMGQGARAELTQAAAEE